MELKKGLPHFNVLPQINIGPISKPNSNLKNLIDKIRMGAGKANSSIPLFGEKNV